MGGKPAGEIIDGVVAAADEAGGCSVEARLRLGEAGTGAVEISRQNPGTQPCGDEVEGLPRRPQMPVGAKPQPLGAIVEALCGYADQVLWIGESARQSGEVEPPLVEEAGETARKARRPAAELRKEIEAHWDRHFRGGSRRWRTPVTRVIDQGRVGLVPDRRD